MPFLNIAGIDVDVLGDGATQREGFIVGEKVRAFDGTMRSTIRATKRTWQFTAGLLTVAQAAALRTAVANGLPVNCTGDAFSGAVISCVVSITDAPFHMDGVSFQRTMVLTLDEA